MAKISIEKSINSDKKHQDITYLLNNMPVIKNYCLDCNFTEPDAIMYSEYIPTV